MFTNNDKLIKYNNIINKDYYIFKDPMLGGSKDTLYYNNDDVKIGSYGNIVDSLISTLTPYEVEKLRLLSMFLSNQGITNLSNNDILTLVSMATNPQYDATIRSIGTRINNVKGNTPNPASVPVTRPIQPITIDTNNKQVSTPIKNEEPKRANPIIEKFLSDIRSVNGSSSFRGWMLPNGELLSQYVDTTEGTRGVRQDHAKLFKVFFAGLEKYNKDAYDVMKKLYDNYLAAHGFSSGDWDESFAVEVLGWMQIAHNGRMRILYRGERWQDRLLRPFLIDYGFNFEISDFGDCHYVEFMSIYDYIDEIISLGLEQKYGRLSA